MNHYESEVRSRWGSTAAFQEQAEKTRHYTKEKWAEANEGMMALFAEFAACRENGSSAGSDEVQTLAARLQIHISEYYYSCTEEILIGLGRMYAADERFRKNIDQYGDGTAEFVSAAIDIYCKGKIGT